MNTPSPEVKTILKDWCKKQEEKYGPNWKEIKAKEMAAETTPAITAFLTLLNQRGK